MNTSKALILGAGGGQIHLMNLCKKYGAEVITVTPEGNWPGIPVADKVYYADVKNIDALMSIVASENPAAIISDQLDAAVYPCAVVAQKSGLRGITPEVAMRFTSKYEMRRLAEKAGILVPQYFVAGNINEAKAGIKNLCFPVIMKPVDSSASHGVFLIDTEDELCRNFPESIEWSKSGSVIIEKVIRGREYVVDAWTHNYKTTNLVVGSRNYFDIPGKFIPSSTLFTDALSANSHEEELVKEANIKFVESSGLEFGITHGEYFYVPEEDNVYLVEIAARGGGVFTASHIIPSACGIDAEELLVREVLGIDSTCRAISRGAAAYFSLLTPEGVIEKVSGIQAVSIMPGVVEAFLDNMSIGTQTAPISDKASRKGPIVVKGATKNDCKQVMSHVKEVLSIKVRTEHGLSDIIW